MDRGSSCAPASVVDRSSEVAALEAAARAVLAACEGAGGWDAVTRRRALVALDAVVNATTVARGKVITAERDAGTWALKGDRDLAGFVGRVSREGRGAGVAAVGQAMTLEAMPAVAEALVAGPVTPRHVQEITRAAAASPLLAAELASPEGQAELVELARRLDGAHFGTALKQMSASLDPASRQREHDEQRARRSLVITRTPGGTLFSGRLDNVAGHKFQKMIDALNPRPAKDDTRPREVRQADALMVGVERILADRATTPGAVAPVQAVVTFTQETWIALRAAHDGGDVDEAANGAATDADGDVPGNTNRRPGKGSAADVTGALRGVSPVLDEAGRAWPASEIARALCDCTLTRVVLDATGRPLDVGWKDRFFTRAQWLALYASGVTTCAVDGRDMPLRYSELHHIQWWENGGRTDYVNLAPECSFHHHDIHKNDIRVFRRPDGTYEHRWPDGRIYGGTPSDDSGTPPGVADDGSPGTLSLYDVA